jgi:heparan-alpha-glucosaminide N-acetyltransferase
MTTNSTFSAGASVLNPQRVASIDILRALTMVLMIFVNDLWSLNNIPAWLEHVERGVDGIGLADVVFPAFLFIVGMSIPFAIENRQKKGDNNLQLFRHILTRTIALLVMGLFLVNGETINAGGTGISRLLWNTLCCASFILIWNSYPKSANRYLVTSAKGIAIATLLVLAFIYRGGPDENLRYFGPQWWGILGMIGWAYLVCASLAAFSKNNLWVILGGWVFFGALSMASKAGYVPEFLSFIPGPILGGTITGFTMGGVLTSLIFRHYRQTGDNKTMTLVFLGFTVVLIALYALTRPHWGLAKLGATPAWLFLCSALTLLTFVAIYWLADVWKKSNWFDFIKPAGTDTLLTYLIPYLAYATMRFLGLHIPAFALTGAAGLLKSFLFALLCVVITGILNRNGVRLKL